MAEKKISIDITADSSGAESAFDRAKNAARSFSGTARDAITSSSRIMQGSMGAASKAVQSFASKLQTAIPNGAEKTRSALERASNKVDAFTSKVEKSAKRFDKSGQSWERIGTAAQVGVAAATAAITAFAYKSVQASAQMEQTRIAFTTMLGSASEASRFLNEMADFAANTPFELPQVLDGSKRLLAMGFTAQQVTPMLTAIGDAASGLGMQTDGINRLTLAIGQMYAKGKVSADEVRQLAEAGIPAWDMIAKKIGVSVPQAMKMAENGAISAADGIQGIISGMNSKFGGMMEGQSKTLLGMWSNIQDSLGITMTVIGDEIAKAFDLHDILKDFKTDLESFSKTVKQNGIKEAMREAFPDSLKVAILGIGSAMTTVAAIAAGGFVKGLLVATGIALSTIGAIVAGVTAVVVAGYYLWENWDTVVKYWDLGWANMKVIAFGAADSIINTLKNIVTVAKNAALNIATLGSTKTKLFDGVSWEWGADTKKAQGQLLELQAKDEIEKMGKAQQAMDDYLNKKSKPKGPTVDDLGLKQIDLSNIGGKKSSGAKKASDNAIAELNRITEKITDMKTDTADMWRKFGNMKLDIEFEGMKGAEKVYEEINREKKARLEAVDDWVAKHQKAVKEAQSLQASAVKNGNAQAIAEASKLYEERVAMAKNAEDNMASYKKMIAEQQKAKEIENATALNAIKAELDEKYRQGDVAGYMNALTEKKAAFIADMEANQQIMDTYQEIMLASQASTAQLIADMYSTTFSGLTTAFSSAITGAKSATEAIKELGKGMLKVVADFVAKWLAAQLTNAIFGQGILTLTVAANKKAGKAIADAYREAAALASLASFGANAIPASIGIAAVYGLTGATPGGGGSTGNFDKGGSGVLGSKTLTEGKNFNPLEINHFAKGGYTGTGFAIVGERGPELVDFGTPGRVYTNNQLGELMTSDFAINTNVSSGSISKGIFQKLGLFDGGSGSSPITAVQNIYGDINNGSDEESLFDSWNDNLAGAMRSC